MNKTEKSIYELLRKNVLLRDDQGVYTIFPQKLLIQASGKSERTVRYSLKNLEEKKYIIRELYREINLLKIYFLKEEDLTGLEIIEHLENDTSLFENKSSPSERCNPLYESCPSSSENCPSLSENCPSSSENCPSLSENCPSLSENCPSSSENDTSPSENCPSSSENCPSPSSENCPSYTYCVGEIRRDDIQVIAQKPRHIHTELSSITAQKKFHDMPDSSASHFLFDILSSGKDIADLPARKRPVNHNTMYEVKQNGDRRLISMETKEGTSKVTVELEDINKINKAGKKFLILALVKANEQALYNGELTRDYISFPLQELVDYGLYSQLNGARKGFEAGAEGLTSIKIKGTIRRSKKSTATIKALEVPFTGAKIENNQCTIYLNTRIDWHFLTQYFTKLPKYYFKLSNRASDLLYYIFYLARQHTNEIAARGYFTISFRAIHSMLKLPSEVCNPKPQQFIKTPIEEAIEEIENEHMKMYNNMDFSLEPVYDENSNITEYLNNGYLKITLHGSFAEPFIIQCQEQKKKIQQSEQKTARIEEKVAAIRKSKKAEK